MAQEIDASAQLIYEVVTGRDWSTADDDERRVCRAKAREVQAGIKGPWPTHLAARTPQSGGRQSRI
ncbi:hypothetical protein [Nitratireductor luteus]|uniref:hypothetical protein n=1 Tax=Nitratireductor luteus TaxID=2976980 RepID=UPI00223EB357|nr:hypothetical protein [Nitratireductor luteus]